MIELEPARPTRQLDNDCHQRRVHSGWNDCSLLYSALPLVNGCVVLNAIRSIATFDPAALQRLGHRQDAGT